MSGKPPEFVNRMHKGEVVTKPRVIDRGDGPKIEGTRITVYTVLEYLRAGRTRDWIATMLKLSSDQVQVAMDYIRDHDAQSMPHTTPSWPVSRKATQRRLKRNCKPTEKRSKPAWRDSRPQVVSQSACHDCYLITTCRAMSAD